MSFMSFMDKIKDMEVALPLFYKCNRESAFKQHGTKIRTCIDQTVYEFYNVLAIYVL